MEILRRKSRQRERIYRVIAASMAHPSAQEIYALLKRDMPRLSLGTVYRNIAILLEENRVQGSDFGYGIVRYDAVTANHYHFCCNRCGVVSDLNMPEQTGITTAARKSCLHRIGGHTIRFHGVCSVCAAAEKVNKKKEIKNGTKHTRQHAPDRR